MRPFCVAPLLLLFAVPVVASWTIFDVSLAIMGGNSLDSVASIEHDGWFGRMNGFHRVSDQREWSITVNYDQEYDATYTNLIALPTAGYEGYCYTTRLSSTFSSYWPFVGSEFAMIDRPENGWSLCIPDAPTPPPTSPPPQQCHTCGGTTEPLVLDLGGDGVSTTDVDRPVFFDLDADGLAEWITWLDGGRDGFLWLDVTPNHRVDSGYELFGVGMTMPSGEKARSGVEALALYDRIDQGGNADGKISVADHIYGRLRIWTDHNGDGVAQRSDEVLTLGQVGVTEISLSFEAGHRLDENGNDHYFRSTFRRRTPRGIITLPIEGLFFRLAPGPHP